MISMKRYTSHTRIALRPLWQRDSLVRENDRRSRSTTSLSDLLQNVFAPAVASFAYDKAREFFGADTCARIGHCSCDQPVCCNCGQFKDKERVN